MKKISFTKTLFFLCNLMNMFELGAFFFSLVVRIDNSVPNTNKFNQLDSTANYSINFEDIKMIFLSFE